MDFTTNSRLPTGVSEFPTTADAPSQLFRFSFGVKPTRLSGTVFPESGLMRCLRIFTAFALFISILSGTSLRADPVRIFAAASLGEVLPEIAEATGHSIVLSLAGSGAIARQIAQGAPADVVILADPKWMDWLENQGSVNPDNRQTPFGNRLALIAPAGAAPLDSLSPQTLSHALGPKGRLAMGHQSAVPAGSYARAWLQSQGLWPILENRLAETENVRAALALVARAETPLGIVYHTDLLAAGETIIEAWPIDAAQQPPIHYALAVLSEQGHSFAAALSTAKARKILRQRGFLPDPPS